ncbi:MAG TPA: 3-hydroxyisobutyryl-CoA hydrolase [Propionibacteriaceae bacterium]|nr:3-hydroxyisobutyryl-CoA hydrolase [Propionibacteriaceae bacterium]
MNEPEVTVEVAATVGRITLNRPRAINAVNLAMMKRISDALAEFAADDRIEGVEIAGAGERGLCAGADVRELRTRAMESGDVSEFFVTEYRLNLMIAAYPKPYRAIMTGITMGGGLGLSAHGAQRVVDATSRLAMPETQIGLFPDVFLTYLFARMPGEIGTHLALTGASINATDAIAVGLADECVGSAPAPDPVLQGAWIAQCYGSDDPAEIVGRLSEHSDPAARAAAEEINRRSPLSIAVSLEALRRAARFATIEAQYDQELALAVRLASGAEFAEGVRAQLVDRDRTPRWSHDHVSQVPRDEVLSYFEPLSA